MAAGEYTAYNYSGIIWSPYGPSWRHARKLCTMELLNAKRLESCEYIRREEMRLLLKGLYESSGQPIVLKDHLLDLSLNMISRMVLGKKYTGGTGENEIVTPKEFKEMLDEWFLLNGVVDIGDSIPWLRSLDLRGYVRKMKALSKKFDRFLEHVLDEHIARRREVKDYVAKDMVDVLLQLAEDPNLDVKLERNRVKAISQDLIAGGTESSAVTVEWTISELLKKPKIFSKATEELDRRSSAMALALLAALVLSPLYVGRKHETRYYEMKLSSGFVLPMVLAGLIIAIRTSSSSSSSMADGGRGWLSPSPDPTWVLGIGGVRRGDWLPPW
ncbi:hypothetical protein V6N13_063120 [Hibiscus sabdariffa]